MASKQPSHTTQTTEVKLPKWVEGASEDNYELAKRLGKQDFDPYKGDRVADLDPVSARAFKSFERTSGDLNKSYNRAGNIFDRIAQTDLNSPDVTMGKLSDVNLDKYMNPFINNVESKALGALDDSRIQALMGNSDAARAAGAFGGSRHGIVDAVTNAESAKDAGLLSAQLRSDAFNTAMQNATTDIQGKYTADTGNRAADMQAKLAELESMQTGATGIMSAADAKQSNRIQDFTGLMQIGATKQAQQQREIDNKIAKHGERRDYDLENLNLRLSALGMSPYGKTENTDKVTEGGSSGTDFATLGSGLLTLLLGLSDDDTKTDKEKVGKLGNTDIDLWAYRYKKDPKTYPKVVGVMASDLEKKMPEAVHEVNGVRLVNYGKIAEMLDVGT